MSTHNIGFYEDLTCEAELLHDKTEDLGLTHCILGNFSCFFVVC